MQNPDKDSYSFDRFCIPHFNSELVNGSALRPADVRVGLGEDAHVILQRGDEIRDELDWNDDACPDGGLDQMFLLGLSYRFLGKRHDLAECQREVEWGVGNRAEIRVGPRLRRLLFGNNREVDLLALWAI